MSWIWTQKSYGITRCVNLNLPIVFIILSINSFYSLFYFVDIIDSRFKYSCVNFQRIYCVCGSGIEKRSALKSLFDGFLIAKQFFRLRKRNNIPYGSIGRRCMSWNIRRLVVLLGRCKWRKAWHDSFEYRVGKYLS